MRMQKRLLFCTLAAMSSQSMAAAYKIPEQSINSTALAGAYVANAHGSDASYYNPAAMTFNEEGAMLEGGLTFIQLSSIDYTGAGFTDSTKTENFVLPTFHYVSPSVGNARFGLSLLVPAGLSKRWKGVGRAFAQEFTLETIEINPNIGYKINDRFSIGGGVRAVYTKGRVESSDSAFPPVTLGRTLKGDSWDFGYNLALQFRATDDLDLAATYRSKVELDVEGYAKLFGSIPPGNPGAGTPLPTYEGGAAVTVPIPATLALAAAYTFREKTTVEFTYERNYWSAYKDLNFSYDTALNPVFTAAFDDPTPKNWDDTNTYRIGVTHQLNPKWTLMAGFAYDESPAPKETIGFELPDSDAKIYSIGARYKHSDALSLGGAFLYDRKDKLTLAPGENSVNGLLAAGAEFENARAYLLTVGFEYKF